ncbi:MAG: hypothetical protein AB7G47_19385 [Mycolicibacterium sp.]|uniref:hypothetical protein n=1 Tax=Mycolicibacterium sp. TaxID=2320850 RepID=UPI003D0965B6
MGQAQDLAMKALNIGLMFAGVLCLLKGGFGVHKNSNGGNDDINMAGWKSMASWWAMGGVMLGTGTYGMFANFFNGVAQYLFG